MRFLHPSTRQLRHWLETPDEASSIDDHVATCDRCAARMENLAAPLPDLATALSRSLEPPGDLVRRLGARMTTSMRNREDLQLLLDLLGVPWRTVQDLMFEGFEGEEE